MTDQILPHVPVIIIGAGQAGLSVNWYLRRDGIDHLVVERHRNFHAWRANRWDSFCLVTPNRQCRLPGWPYRGPDPNGFMLRDEIVDYLDGFTASFDPPLREGTSVTRVTPVPEGYRVETTADTWITGQVVVATGGYDRPIVPPYAGAIAPQITQMHSSITAAPQNCRPVAR